MSKIELNHNKKVKHRNKSLIWSGFVLAILLIVTSIIGIIFYLKINQHIAYTELQNPIINNGTIYNEEARIYRNEVYLPFSLIKKEIDDSAIYDEQSQSVILTPNDQVIQFPNEDLQYFINDEPITLHIPTLINDDDGRLYLAAEPLQSIYRYQVDYIKDSGIVILNKHGETVLPGKIISSNSEIKLREAPRFFSGYIDKVTSQEKVIIEREEENYYYIRKQNGRAGFLQKEEVTLEQPIIVNIENKGSRKEWNTPKLNWPIHLTWEAVYSKNPDTTMIPVMPGVNVVSPTWFSLKNTEGDVRNLASLDYVKWAKSRQYQVWALFSNDFDPEKTHLALKDYTKRQKIIRQLLQYANMYQLDGINLDFENVNLEDRDLVTQFVRELTAYLHQAGLTVSMDITFISTSENWSMFYDREKLGSIVDYLIVMAYDEHWGTSPVAGSVASLPWVENNLLKLLEIVPNERLILGVPTYTRIWKEQKTPGGNIEVSSKAYSIDKIQEWMRARGISAKYDEKTGQDYVEYIDNNEQAIYKIWLENEKSLSKRTQLVHQYQLAGIATWNRSFANNSSWATINNALKQQETVRK